MAGGEIFSRFVSIVALLSGLTAVVTVPVFAADAADPGSPAVVAIPALRDTPTELTPAAPAAPAPMVVVPNPSPNSTPSGAAPTVVMPKAPSTASYPAPAAGTPAAAIYTALSGSNSLVLGGRALDQATLITLYGPRGFQPIWTEARQNSFHRALDKADSHGLDAHSFAVTTTQPASRELLLTDAFLRYAAALARGRVNPKDFETDWRIDPPVLNAGQVFGAAINGDV